MADNDEVPGQLITKYVAWIRKNITPGKKRGILIAEYAQGVTRGQIRKAWKEFYDKPHKENK